MHNEKLMDVINPLGSLYMKNIVSPAGETFPFFKLKYHAVKHLHLHITAFSLVFLAFVFVLPIDVHARETDTVKVGYYENEVFQEGAREGIIKSGYAYEYY